MITQDPTGDVGFTELVGERITLRRFRLDDLLAFVTYRSDPTVARYQSWDAPYPAADGRKLIEHLLAQHPDTPGDWYQYAATLRSTGALIGDVGVGTDAADARLTEIGYTIATAHQGHGYGTEAVRLILRYLFGERGKHRVHARCDPRNVASIKLLESLRLRREGHLCESFREHDAWADELIYAMLDYEWRGHL